MIIRSVWIALLLVIVGVTTLATIRERTPPPPAPHDRIAVAATFYPIAHFAQIVGGEYLAVTQLVGAGVEPHEFEPTPRDRANVAGTSLFLIHGGAVDAWAHKIAEQLPNVPTVAISPTNNDPHTWLDPLLARQMVETIRDTFIQIAPANRPLFENNALQYLQELSRLDEDYRNAFSSCQQKRIITSHNAFGLLAARYGLRVIPIAGFSPEEEPSLKQLSDIAKLAKETGIRAIFAEPLASPKLAETIARETGAAVRSLNPIEGLTNEEETRGATYLSIMRENLQALLQAFNCQARLP